MRQVFVDIGQIPEGVDGGDYPDGTIFVWSEDKPKRDPFTHKMIRPEPMKLIWPEDVQRMLEEDK